MTLGSPPFNTYSDADLCTYVHVLHHSKAMPEGAGGYATKIDHFAYKSLICKQNVASYCLKSPICKQYARRGRWLCVAHLWCAELCIILLTNQRFVSKTNKIDHCTPKVVTFGVQWCKSKNCKQNGGSCPQLTPTVTLTFARTCKGHRHRGVVAVPNKGAWATKL